jgi:hypothetical protein
MEQIILSVIITSKIRPDVDLQDKCVLIHVAVCIEHEMVGLMNWKGF